MLVEEAVRIARRWAREEGPRLPGFGGAFLTGSALWAAPGSVLPSHSDVDVMVVLDAPSEDLHKLRPEKPPPSGGFPPEGSGRKLRSGGEPMDVPFPPAGSGRELRYDGARPDASFLRAGRGRKLRYGGVLLEVSPLPAARLASADAVLGDYHLAGAFHRPGVLADPAGRLSELCRDVSHRFAERRWVLARCEHAMETVRARLATVGPPGPMSDQVNAGVVVGSPGPLPDQVNAWLFGTGVTAHVLLVAGLRNPTVRRRYAATRELLAERGLPDLHEHLLDLLGCAAMAPDRVRHHLSGLERLFGTASRADAPGYAFDSDITDTARPIAIDGSRALIDAGLHREAVFWLAATYARCLLKLTGAGRPAPADGLLELLADLGADTPAARRARADAVLAALPALRQTAERLAPPT